MSINICTPESLENISNCSVGLRTCCADRKKNYRQRAKIPITVGDFNWIFACNYEGTE
jgi:hypothetical protein